ncbi:MAG: oxidoreductase [Sphingobacteriaceae bacterium]|nr:oxidoreductase [Sphingobacteriaceae bacterium]
MRKLIILFACLPLVSLGQIFRMESLASIEMTSLRGLSVVSNEVAWVSGSNGMIGKTEDGGQNWEWTQPKGFEELDFRDIEAFDEKKAIVINAGSPAYILMTEDGGGKWKKVYQNLDTAIFLDGMSFWDKKNGLIFGDPIKNKMQLLKTTNGGYNWTEVETDSLSLVLAEDEAGFAASGSTIKTLDGGYTWIATGGSESNIYFSNDYAETWNKYPCPILQGEASQGVFSIDFIDEKNGIAVGGDYTKEKESKNNALITTDGGQSWFKPTKSVLGYRSGVAYLDRETCYATGVSGTDYSKDGGKTWRRVSLQSFNAIQKAKKGNLILLVGNKGQISRLIEE